MYRLVFEDDSWIEIPEGLKGIRLYIAKWNGKNVPKYIYILLKEKYIGKDLLKSWEEKLRTVQLRTIFKYDEDGQHLDHAISIPKPLYHIHYEEGDMIIEYGDVLYSDDAY